MASSDVLSQTLYSITNIKLDQLSKQKAAYETAKAALLQNASTGTAVERTRVLADGGQSLPTMNLFGTTSAVSVKTIGRLLDQAEHDPSVSTSSVEASERALRDELDVHSEKYRFAELYGKLVNEWIASGKTEDALSDADSGFIPVGRAEMHSQRATWEEYVFDAKHTDGAAITAYLESLFRGGASKDVAEAFKNVTEGIDGFQEDWDTRTHFDDESLDTCIRGLLRSDLLNDQKRTTLNDFLGNKAVLREIADVLNMRMQTRKDWAWDSECLVEQRRSLNGRYRFYPDEDLLQSILLYYVGRAWCVEVRQRFVDFLAARKVMKPAVRYLSKDDARRRQYFLSPAAATLHDPYSVNGILEKHFREEILLDQLPKTMGEQRGGYGDDSTSDEDTRKGPVQVVQELLQILQTVVTMRRGLGGETTVVRSDFTWFGPSVPHSSIFAVLSFLGVRADWVDFFRRALECPLRFEDDAPGAPARLRKRGLPLSTPIADFFAESLLFCLDYAVNQKADGARLYRLHDDMWMFDTTERCAKAWGVVTEFSDLVGLGINEDKTGSVVVRPPGAAPVSEADMVAAGLPKGAVVWGFLTLDAASGRFLIDQAKVDGHIAELRLQLDACRSVFDWIQAWNIYGVRFFQTNFGGFANCYARAHVDSVLRTFRRIQDALFPGGAAGRLRAMLAERFGARDVPDGYLSYPVDLGGLGLLNPFVTPLSQRDTVEEDAEAAVARLREREEREYASEREEFEASEAKDGEGDRYAYRREAEWDDLRDEVFMSFEEFTRHRERRSRAFADTFTELRGVPAPAALGKPESVPGLAAALRKMKKTSKDGTGWGDADGWERVSTYDQWVCVQHAQDMVARFGGVTIVEKGLLPMGLIDMLRQSRFKWQT